MRRARKSRDRISTAATVRVATSQGEAELAADPRDPAVRVLSIEGLEVSAVHLGDPARLPMDYLHRLGTALDALLPRGVPVEVVHLGGGAFALPRFVAATRPLARQEVYELEPALVQLAREHLRLRRGPALRVRVGDAAVLLARRPPASADAVVGDAFVGTEVPGPLTGEAFAHVVRRALRPGGLHLLNVVDAPPFEARRRHVAALRAAFPHVVTFGARDVVGGRRAGNVLFAASDGPLAVTALRRALAAGPHPAIVAT